MYWNGNVCKFKRIFLKNIYCATLKIMGLMQWIVFKSNCSFTKKWLSRKQRVSKPVKFQDHFGEYWVSNMYLFTCRIKIKMKCSFSTFNHKILNHTILIVCRKKSQPKWPHGLQDYNNWRGKKSFWWTAQIVVNVLKFNRN
jgi:hypothetical protein